MHVTFLYLVGCPQQLPCLVVKVMGEVWISVMMGILHGVTFIYDAVTYIPQRLVFKPKKRLQKSQRVKVSQKMHTIIYN